MSTSDIRTETFQTSPRLKLSLSDLTSTARVTRAEDGSTTSRVEVRGDSKYRDSVTVAYDPSGNRLTVREPEGTGGGVSIIGGDVVIGGRTVQTNTFGRGLSSIVTSARGNVRVSGGGRSVSISGGRVVIDGKDVTSLIDGKDGGEPVDVSARSITIVVPAGTDTGVDDSADVTLQRIGGRVRANLTGEARLVARQATGVKLDLSGSSRVDILESSGEINLDVAGASYVSLGGQFGDVELDISGASRIDGNGTFGHVSGDVAGASSVRLSGRADGNSVRTSGASSVRIDAPAGRRSGGHGAWDF